MTTKPVRWIPDERSRQILNAFASHNERTPSVLRRALELLAQADGIVDGRGRIRPAANRRAS